MGLQFVLEARLDGQRSLARRSLAVRSRLLMMMRVTPVMASGSLRFLRPRARGGRGDGHRGGLQPVDVVLGRRFRVRPLLQGSRGTSVRF